MTDEAELRRKAEVYRWKREALIEALQTLTLMTIGAGLGLVIVALVLPLLP